MVTGCLQGTLLGMGIYFEVMDRRKKKDQRSNGAVGAESSNLNGHAQGPTTADEGGPEAEGDGAEGDERTPLLRNAAEG